MGLEMREIEAFLAVAEELHFGRAAERLTLSTSRVSNLVRTVERRAGTPLFERTSRRVRLTPSGEHLFTELRAAYVRIERAVAEVREAAGQGGKVLRVGFSTTLPEKVAPALVEAFEGRFPAARIVQSAHPTVDLFDWIEAEGRWPVDVFVTWMPVESAPLTELVVGPVLQRTPRAVMMAVDHPLAGGTAVHVEDLAEHDVIYPSLPKWYGDAWAPAVTPAGRKLSFRRPDSRYIEDVLPLVAEQRLVHLTFSSLLDAYHRPGVVVLPLLGLPSMPIRPVWAAATRNALGQSFVDEAVAFARAAGWPSGGPAAASG
ncbi:LysR family transcriptional regulator [Streptomyces qinglanensis]|uniref:DNA-binding transcriptional regulator, LysR family n=1 Tax=Streptomyces qinglanensis TaxID=943816 RepID=A0A1H9R1Y5_9ACTN|nr:LysR family transcriptional regulator [Streptomyces qinglanensis]SER66720.1 DNA-binding transcriptional regulator, LysR family [Streptomyces qinglanensis]